ncbi:MAG: GMP/IMP nucleotidase [Gammaproteobacteria bacterium]|jgi:putative hydrolase of the HAD superfamily
MSFIDGAHFDWESVDTVLLDMDGTLLDLRFDNFFWQELVPRRYGEARGIGLEEAHRRLLPKFARKRGTLDWYCLDYWSRELGMDIAGLKEEVRDHIDFLPDVPEFLRAVRQADKRLVLVTNAHPETLRLKLRRTGLQRFLDALHSSHDIGLPKEDISFWERLRVIEPFEPERTALVDDSLPVLRAAHDYGIGRVIAIRRPDSTRPARAVEEFPGVDRLADLGHPPGKSRA